MGERFNHREYEMDLDNILAGVMPESWFGHARIVIRESDAIPQETEQQALKTVQMSVEERDMPAEKVAESFIERYNS